MSSPSVSDYYLYAVTVGVADGGVADAVNIMSFSSFFSFCPFVFLSNHVWLTLKPQNYICIYFACFCLPFPPPIFSHCALKSGIVHKFVPQELIIGLQCLPTHRHRVTSGRNIQMGRKEKKMKSEKDIKY